MISRSTDIKSALRSRQRGFLLNPYRFGAGPSNDPNFANVSLLLHCDGADLGTTFTDHSGTPKTVVRSNVTTSTTQYKFGGASALIGTSGYLECANESAFDLGTGDFTIEMWVRSTTAIDVTYAPTLFDGRASGGSGSGPVLYADVTTGNILYFAGGSNRITGGTISINSWTHIAVARASAVTKLFINGTQSGSSYSGDTINLNGMRPRIASNWALSAGTSIKGNVDDIRITKGVCRYTSSFTPPTAAFPNS